MPPAVARDLDDAPAQALDLARAAAACPLHAPVAEHRERLGERRLPRVGERVVDVVREAAQSAGMPV
jgi:hypothetical protein